MNISGNCTSYIFQKYILDLQYMTFNDQIYPLQIFISVLKSNICIIDSLVMKNLTFWLKIFNYYVPIHLQWYPRDWNHDECARPPAS